MASLSITRMHLRHRCSPSTSNTTTMLHSFVKWICMTSTKLATSRTRSVFNTRPSSSLEGICFIWSNEKSLSKILSFKTKIFRENIQLHSLKWCLITKWCGLGIIRCRCHSHAQICECWWMEMKRLIPTRSCLLIQGGPTTIILVNWWSRVISETTLIVCQGLVS